MQQEPEPRLPGLLKMLLWAQQRLDERMEYPKCVCHRSKQPLACCQFMLPSFERMRLPNLQLVQCI